MAANEGMEGKQYPRELDMRGRQKEAVFEIRPSQSHVKTSCRRRLTLVEYIDWATISARAVDV
jgi:hypothetical protein